MEDLVPCKKCGRPIARSAQLCPGCGTMPALDLGCKVLGVLIGVPILLGLWSLVLLAALAAFGDAGGWGVVVLTAGLPVMAFFGFRKQRRAKLHAAG